MKRSVLAVVADGSGGAVAAEDAHIVVDGASFRVPQNVGAAEGLGVGANLTARRETRARVR